MSCFYSLLGDMDGGKKMSTTDARRLFGNLSTHSTNRNIGRGRGRGQGRGGLGVLGRMCPPSQRPKPSSSGGHGKFRQLRLNESSLLGNSSSGGSSTGGSSTERSPTGEVATRTTTTTGSFSHAAKSLNLRNYLNLMDAIDGLRYQLPGLATEATTSIFSDLAQRTVIRLARENVVGTAATDFLTTTRLVGRPHRRRLYVCDDWSSLLRDRLLPLFELVIGPDDRRKRFDPRLRVNAQMKEYDKETTNVVVASSSDDQHSTAAPIARCARFLNNLRTNYYASTSLVLGYDATPPIGSSSCACCFFSPAVYVFCSVTAISPSTDPESARYRSNETVFARLFRESGVPAVCFDVASLLCRPVSEFAFERDFRLPTSSVPPLGTPVTDGPTFVNLLKGSNVFEMGFMRNVFAMHAVVNAIVDWAWIRQRALHVRLNGKRASVLDVPPVTVYLSRELCPLFDRVDTVPWTSLRRSRKIVVHTV